MAEKITAYCGLICTECDAYIATQADDVAALRRMADSAAAQFGITMTVDDARCNGCLVTEGFQCGYCKECGVRACAMERGLANCAYCPDYGCATLTAFLEQASKARQNLEAIRALL